MGERSARVVELDGLRGWAALGVAAFHFNIELFGKAFPGFHQWLFFLNDGDIAIAVFFVLSGYVLTRGRWRQKNTGLLRTLLARYARLTIPVLVASLLTLAVMGAGLTATADAAVIVARGDWLGGYARFAASLQGAAWYAVARVYWIVRAEDYNPFLWTMIIELWCSVVVLSLSHFKLPGAWPYVVLGALLALALFWYPRAAGMAAGALLALAATDWKWKAPAVDSRVGLAAFVGAMALAWATKANEWPYQINVLSAVVMTLAALHVGPVRMVLSTPISRYLGKLSFPIYLSQFAVLITLSSHLIIMADAHGAMNPFTALAIGAASLLATVLVAQGFVFVERLTAFSVRRIRGRASEVTSARIPEPA